MEYFREGMNYNMRENIESCYKIVLEDLREVVAEG